MAAPAQTETEQPSPTATEWALIAAILGLLVIGAGAVALARQVARLLKVTPRAAAMAVGVIGYKPGQYRRTYVPASTTQTTRSRVTGGDAAPPSGEGATGPGGPAAPPTPRPGTTAAGITRTAEDYYRAAFLRRSSQRIQDAIDKGGDPQVAVDREKRLWKSHFAAFQRRALVAKQVDLAAAEHGDLLGWDATIDARTSPECERADGKNFYVNRPPTIGYPGAVHPRCRCKPTAPYPGAGLVEGATASMGGSGFERRAAGGR
ncbi:hypothetical protein ACIBSV_46790 [Embleya sp. NPDC050154]|uniref:hypothetical protein n=1 Tax=Embleya sp. NPDC050154 TaxID=3363988 RepID=UPI003799E308